MSLEEVKQQIRNVADWPKKGIQFKDITTAVKVPEIFSFLVDTICDIYKDKGITKVVCMEARGFILGGALAYKLGAGFVPIRKPGKLPAKKISQDYILEYGAGSLELHSDAISEVDVVLLHDDLLATGGTALASIKLIQKLQPEKIYISFMCELDFLKGRELLKDYEIASLIHF
ncbi:MAG: adenine phosphoribosyltransferase [Bacteroidales bacterium]|nr:adenine phosphoribosyltransferase [Bacteroidales bacterium]